MFEGGSYFRAFRVVRTHSTLYYAHPSAIKQWDTREFAPNLAIYSSGFTKLATRIRRYGCLRIRAVYGVLRV